MAAVPCVIRMIVHQHKGLYLQLHQKISCRAYHDFYNEEKKGTLFNIYSSVPSYAHLFRLMRKERENESYYKMSSTNGKIALKNVEQAIVAFEYGDSTCFIHSQERM